MSLFLLRFILPQSRKVVQGREAGTMAADYSYPVLVELEETNTPRLKNKLVKYFQSKKSNGGDCEVVYESGSPTVLLRFRREEDNTEFIESCPQNRMFTRKSLSIRPLETTVKVVVEGISDCSVDMLCLYFESKGGDVEDVQLNEAEQSAVITFKNHQALEAIRCDLEKHFCNVMLEQSAVRLSASPLLLKQKDAKAIIKEWTDTVKSALAQAVSKFKSIKFSLELDVWKESEQKVKEKLQKEDVVVVPDKSSGVLSVAGLLSDVNKLEKPVSELLSKIKERVRREKLSKTQEINVSPSMFHILSEDGVQDKLLQVYPELKMSYDQKNKALKVTGFVDEIIDATKVISNAMFTLKRQNLDIDQFLLDMLKEEQQEEATDALLTAYNVKAALDISPQRVQLVAVSDNDLISAQDHLSQTLKSQYIEVEDSEVLKMLEWQQLVHQLETANSVSGMRTQIITRQQQVVVSGHKDIVDKVSSELDDFLTQKAHVEELVAVEANVIIEYLNSQTPCLKKLEGGVDVSFGKEDIILSGCRAAVIDGKTIVTHLLSSVFFDSFKVTNPGVKKFFQEKESMYAALIKSDTGCLVQLVDNSKEEQEDFALVQVQKPIYKIQTTDGVEIVVSKADLCSYSVDAIVNPSSDDLKHDGGLGLALSTAAGPQLQAVCDKIINLKGKLRPGDCVITDAGGMLCCKKLIHAVGPVFDQSKPKKAEAQLKRTVKESLELAEKCGCVSVALPAISRSLGFPLNLCLVTIVKALKEYCDERCDDNPLKKIHLVDNEDNVTLGMEAAVKQEFGNYGVSVSPQNPFPKVSQKSQLVKLAPSDPSLCKAQTKEGLNIVLKKGNIEASKTEVIVNTVAEDLILNKGAVSNAIFSAAGPKLQQLVHNQQTGGTPAEKTCLTSITFPAVGTGNLGFPKDLVVSLMMDKILEFSSQRQSKHLKKVAVVLYPGDTQTIKVVTGDITKETTDVIVNSSNDSFTLKSGVSKAILDAAGVAVLEECQYLAIFISESPEKNKEEDEFDIETIKVDPTFFHICGGTQASVDAAKKKITDLISEQQDSMDITDNAILNFSSADCQCIVDIQRNMGVSIKNHIINGQASLLIEGLCRDVLRANREIENMLKKVRNEQELKKKWELAATVADWQYQRHGLQYQSFDQMNNYELEHALERGMTSVKVTIQGSNYTVQLPKGPATDSKGNVLQIRRHDKLKADDVPEFWEPMPAGQTCHAVPLQSGSSEYAEILNLFKATCNRAVTKIERIQNPALWKSLQIKKHEMEVRNNHQNNDKRLFHGTSEATVPIINERGFNRSYAGKNGETFRDFFDTYSRPNQKGEKFMYLCRVLTGDHTLGQQNMIAPPSKGSSAVDMYDSVVDNMTTPSMFIVFHDTQAYPEYLITFK
ncbi:hypothetical protein GOODEAATRI_014819 [Goodea atripinnis]|uniref:Poly [ADP-ribose] polymerase n=1 Tax=Goodea atripinnis TaxID=208336 RepID=A0ABV0NX82_9TELE